MRANYQRAGVWSGIAFYFLFFASCWPLAHFIPPPSPMLSGSDLLLLYGAHPIGIKLSITIGYLAAMLIVPWSAVLSIQMARIEGPYPMLSIIAFGAGVADAVAFYLPFIFWAAVFYRANNAPEIVQFGNDMAWLEFVMLYAPFALQTLMVAIIGFSDTSATPTFPRWFCYLSLWTDMLIVPGGFANFFTRGPFAWNGLLAFWTPVAIFTVYYAALFPLMFKAIRRQERGAFI